jgi:hypothetical protein
MQRGAGSGAASTCGFRPPIDQSGISHPTVPHFPPNRAVTTLQGNQLRQLVESSLHEYLGLFRRHATKAPPSLPVTGGGSGGNQPAAAAAVGADKRDGVMVAAPPLDPHSEVARWSVPPVFETELVLEGGEDSRWMEATRGLIPAD